MKLNRVRVGTSVVEFREKDGGLVGRIEEFDTHYKAYVEGYGYLRLGYAFESEAEEDIVKKYKEIN